jgi:DNA repair ATPase RecN
VPLGKLTAIIGGGWGKGLCICSEKCYREINRKMEMAEKDFRRKYHSLGAQEIRLRTINYVKRKAMESPIHLKKVLKKVEARIKYLRNHPSKDREYKSTLREINTFAKSLKTEINRQERLNKKC